MSRRLDHEKLEVYQAALTFITWPAVLILAEVRPSRMGPVPLCQMGMSFWLTLP